MDRLGKGLTHTEDTDAILEISERMARIRDKSHSITPAVAAAFWLEDKPQHQFS